MFKNLITPRRVLIVLGVYILALVITVYFFLKIDKTPLPEPNTKLHAVYIGQQTAAQNNKFNLAIAYVLENEGGLSDHPLDRGGVTKYGISQSSYPKLNIRTLTKEDAINIYKRDFYDRFMLHRINDQNVLNKVFDMAVLMGKARATLIFESTLIKLGFAIPKDGILDDEMIKIINDQNPETVLSLYKEELKRFINRIIEVNPSQSIFKAGWLKRINK